MSDPVNNNLSRLTRTGPDSEEEQKIGRSQEDINRVALGRLSPASNEIDRLHPNIFAPSASRRVNVGVTRTRIMRTPSPTDDNQNNNRDTHTPPPTHPPRKTLSTHSTPPRIRKLEKGHSSSKPMSEDEESGSDDSRGPSPPPTYGTLANVASCFGSNIGRLEPSNLIRPKPVFQSFSEGPAFPSSFPSLGIPEWTRNSSKAGQKKTDRPLPSSIRSAFLGSPNSTVSPWAKVLPTETQEKHKKVPHVSPRPNSSSSSSSYSSTSYNNPILGTPLTVGLPSSGSSEKPSKTPPPAPRRGRPRGISDPQHSGTPLYRYVNVDGFGKVSFSSDISKTFEKKMSAMGHITQPNGEVSILKIAQGLEVFFDQDMNSPMPYDRMLRTYARMIKVQYSLLNSTEELISAFTTQFAFASSDPTEATPSFQSENAQFVLIQPKASSLLVEGDKHFFKELYTKNREVFFPLLSLLFEGVFEALKREEGNNLSALMNLDLKPENLAFTCSRKEIEATLSDPEKTLQQKAKEIFVKMAIFDFHYQPKSPELVFAANFKNFLINNPQEDSKIIQFFKEMIEKMIDPDSSGKNEFPEETRPFIEGLLYSLRNS